MEEKEKSITVLLSTLSRPDWSHSLSCQLLLRIGWEHKSGWVVSVCSMEAAQAETQFHLAKASSTVSTPRQKLSEESSCSFSVTVCSQVAGHRHHDLQKEMNPGDVVLTPGLPHCWTESLNYSQLTVSTCFLGWTPQPAGAVEHTICSHGKWKKSICQLVQRNLLGYTYSGPWKDPIVLPSPSFSLSVPRVWYQIYIASLLLILFFIWKRDPDRVLLESQTNR